VVITEGDGRGVYFRPLGAGVFAAPPGEFTKLQTVGDSLYRLYPDGAVAVFDHLNQLIRVADRFGNRTSYSYSSGRVSSITDPAGKQYTFAYNGSGKLTTITDAVGRGTSVTVNGSGDLTQIVAPGSTMAFSGTYNSDHRLRTRTGMRSDTSGYAYDFAFRIAADTLPSVTPYVGGATRPVISYKAWETAALVSACTCVRPRINPDTLRATVTDPVGNATKIAFDRYFGATVINAPLGHTTTIQRNPHGLPTSIVEPSGASRAYTWDSNGNVATVQQPSTSQTIIFTYHPTWKTDPTKVAAGNSETLYTYGSTGELTTVRVNQDTTRYEYFAGFRLKKITDPENHVTNYVYQTTGFKNTASVSETSSAGTTRTTTFGYDSYGRTNAVTTPTGTTSYLYDILDRVTRVTDPTSRATNYAYDGPYVQTVTDAASKVFRFNRNAVGWVDSVGDPNALYIKYKYDVAGNLRTVKNRRGQDITMVPDALGRVISRTADGATTTYAFDNPAGRWLAATNTESKDTVHYDDRGRVTREVARFGTKRYEVASGYLDEGPRNTMQVSGPTWNRTVTYGYNPALQLTTIAQPVGGVTKTTWIAYNKDGLPSTITYPTSTSVQHTFGYTASHLPQTSGWAPLRVNYSYDSTERLTKRMSALGDSARILTYNARGELTNVRDEEYATVEICPTGEETDCYWEEQTTVLSNIPYTYDAVWNRTGSGITLQATSNRYQTFGGYTFEYDPDGNMTRKYKSGFNQVFSWNSLGQLTGVTTNGVAVTYRYNGFGERVYRAAGSDVRQFVYDGPDLVLEVSTAGTKLREYTHFPGVDQPHSMFDGNGTAYYYAMDYPGHVAGLFNTSGSVVNRYRYSTWGAPETTSEGISNSLRFTSRELDAQTGVYYVRNRWYDATVARFLSEDPIGLEGGINVYAYVGNSPTNGRDPFGLWPWATVRDRFSTPRDEGYNGAASSRGGGSRVGNVGRGISDGVGGNGPRDNNVSSDNPSACTQARFVAAGAVLLDVVTLTTGGFLAFRLVQASAMRAGALRAGAQGMWNYGGRGAYTLSLAQRDAARGAVPGLFFGITGLIPTDAGYTASAGALTGDLSLWDFVPVVGSVRAVQAAIEAC
jgi:RHS repeat-associated protein